MDIETDGEKPDAETPKTAEKFSWQRGSAAWKAARKEEGILSPNSKPEQKQTKKNKEWRAVICFSAHSAHEPNGSSGFRFRAGSRFIVSALFPCFPIESHPLLE
jgi:hypothetical protein